MMLYSVIILILFVLTAVTNAITSTITEMELRAYQENAHYQSVRQKLFKSGRHRTTQKQNIEAGSAVTFAELFEQIEKAQKIVQKQRQMEKLFNKMLQITNRYSKMKY